MTSSSASSGASRTGEPVWRSIDGRASFSISTVTGTTMSRRQRAHSLGERRRERPRRRGGRGSSGRDGPGPSIGDGQAEVLAEVDRDAVEGVVADGDPAGSPRSPATFQTSGWSSGGGLPAAARRSSPGGDGRALVLVDADRDLVVEPVVRAGPVELVGAEVRAAACRAARSRCLMLWSVFTTSPSRPDEDVDRVLVGAAPDVLRVGARRPDDPPAVGLRLLR